jgi:hypothetical protein
MTIKVDVGAVGGWWTDGWRHIAVGSDAVFNLTNSGTENIQLFVQLIWTNPSGAEQVFGDNNTYPGLSNNFPLTVGQMRTYTCPTGTKDTWSLVLVGTTGNYYSSGSYTKVVFKTGARWTTGHGIKYSFEGIYNPMYGNPRFTNDGWIMLDPALDAPMYPAINIWYLAGQAVDASIPQYVLYLEIGRASCRERVLRNV